MANLVFYSYSQFSLFHVCLYWLHSLSGPLFCMFTLLSYFNSKHSSVLYLFQVCSLLIFHYYVLFIFICFSCHYFARSCVSAVPIQRRTLFSRLLHFHDHSLATLSLFFTFFISQYFRTHSCSLNTTFRLLLM